MNKFRVAIVATLIVGMGLLSAHADRAKGKDCTITGGQFRAIFSVNEDFTKLIRLRENGLNKVESYRIKVSEDEKTYSVYFKPLSGEINGGDVRYIVSKKDYSVQNRAAYR